MYTKDFRFLFFPYCLQRKEDGRYAVLNRDYKPVGNVAQNFEKFPDPDDYPFLVNLKGLNKAKAAKLSYEGNADTDCIYLYNDGCNPTSSKDNMKSYLEKLEILAKLRVEFE